MRWIFLTMNTKRTTLKFLLKDVDSSDEIYTVIKTIPTETLYVQVTKIGSKFNWLNGFL